MRLNPQTIWLSWSGIAITTIADYLGITTLDLPYLVPAEKGFLLPILGWLYHRVKIKADRHASAERFVLDRQRTWAVIEYLSRSETHNIDRTDEIFVKGLCVGGDGVRIVNNRAKTSYAVLRLILAGASILAIFDQLLDKKEGDHKTAKKDGIGIWTIWRGTTAVDGSRWCKA
ncbi:TPA: hypothetical protein L1M51_000746 [Enterobacter chengduensis]|nr:hypothetical protein [Enterobacter chengduensis]